MPEIKMRMIGFIGCLFEMVFDNNRVGIGGMNQFIEYFPVWFIQHVFGKVLFQFAGIAIVQ
jgi:hypothetical protein